MENSCWLLRFFQCICRFNFGCFKADEGKKFLKMGVIFALIIGVYWTLRPLKDAIFIRLIGSQQLPYAKTVSVLGLLPLVMLYTKLLQHHSRERMLMILPSFYGIAILSFSGVMLWAEGTSHAQSLIMTIGMHSLGYLWYLFVESFGSLFPALFWAFAADTTAPDGAKGGFPLVYAFGQLGGVLFPYGIGGLPHRIGCTTDALSILCLGIMTLAIIPLVRFFLTTTPPNLLDSFASSSKHEQTIGHESGFLGGFKLLISHRYLLAMFAVNFIFEVIVTIFDFNFKVAASTEFSGVALSNYLSLYGSSVNVVSLSCFMLGISNITRFCGVGIALAAMPLIVGGALCGFLSSHGLGFFFLLMVGSKAINYALNGPALKQLYIPTTPDVRFKAEAWIETFGTRASKQIGSLFNMTLAPLQSTFGAAMGRSYYLMFSGAFCFPLLGLWMVAAIFLGRSFNRAVHERQVIC